MKRILFLACTLAATSPMAQPTLTFPFSEELLDQAPTFNFGGEIEEGASGANQIWDFSDVVFPQVLNVLFDIPANTEFASSYPDADLVAITEEVFGTNHVFYNFESDGVYTAGQEVTGTFGISQPFSNTRRDIASPLSYEDSFTDDAEFASTTLGLTTDGVSDFSFEVDGYGTLITPDATYNNVLRIHTLETTTLTYDPGIGEPIITETVVESYRWVIDGYPFPIVLSFIETDDGEPGDPISRYISGVPLLTSDYNSLKGVYLYPVPAVDFVNLDMGDNQTGKATIRIFDIRGAVIKEFAQGMAQVTRFDVSDLPSGFYSINIQTEEGMATKHFAK